MSRVDTSIRSKRFRTKKDANLKLVAETLTGQRLEFTVYDASLRGIGANLVRNEDQGEMPLSISDLIPESKLIWGDYECALGRLSVARVLVDEESKEVFAAFSCIDAHLPMMGNLARCFHEIDRGIESPLEAELSSKKFNIANFGDTEFPHPDLFERCRQYSLLLKDHRKNPLFQYYSTKRPSEGARTTYKLTRTGRRMECVSFASYDYLGLSDHAEVKEAAIKAIERYGISSCGSMILAGKTELHEELEMAVAHKFQKDDCLLFTTGYAANLGSITGLLRPGDLVIADIYSHASLADAINSSKAKARYFKHNNFANLTKLLDENRDAANGTLLVIEGLYSMEGTTPDLREFARIALEYNARTFIDECHSIGVFGPDGLGAAARDGVLQDIDVFMGSFSKGLGIGALGFIAGSQEMIDWLRFFARAGMFSSATPPALAAASLKILDILSRDESHMNRLKENVRRFRQGLRKIGITSPACEESPIIPIVVSDEAKLGVMNQVLLDMGIYVNCILYPAVPQGMSRFRFSITAKHTFSDIDLAIAALARAFDVAMYRHNEEESALPKSSLEMMNVKKLKIS